MLNEEQGIKAIIALQTMVGVTETEEQAKKGWDMMSDFDKKQTENAHHILLGGFSNES